MAKKRPAQLGRYKITSELGRGAMGVVYKGEDPALDRTVILRAVTQELGPTREAVLEAAVQRLDLSQKHAAEAYTLAEQFETNPRSVWGYVQGLTRLSQRTPWQDGRFALDRAASRLLTTVH